MVQVKVAGRYKLEALKLDSSGQIISKRLLADWFSNLITNGGLDRMATQLDYASRCHVGSGSNTPQVTDSSLQSWVAVTTTVNSNITGTNSSPLYAYSTRVYRFAEGAAAGNLSEVGIGWLSSNSGMFSRALILDGDSNPTTITVLSDEVLDVTYELRFYAYVDDFTGTINFTGSIGGSYDYIIRAAEVGTILAPAAFVLLSCNAYTGDIQAITGTPSGTTAALTVSSASYSAGTFERYVTVSASLTQANLVGGIRSLRLSFGASNTHTSRWQVQFTPNIPKTSSTILSITFRISWSRYAS